MPFVLVIYFLNSCQIIISGDAFQTIKLSPTAIYLSGTCGNAPNVIVSMNWWLDRIFRHRAPWPHRSNWRCSVSLCEPSFEGPCWMRSAANWSTRMRCRAEKDQSQVQTDRRCWDRRRTLEILKPFWISACSARMSDFRCGSSSAAIFGFERLWTLVSNGGGDPQIQRLMAILTFERRQSSDLNNSGDSHIWVAANVSFEQRWALDSNGGGDYWIRKVANLSLERRWFTWRHRKLSEGSFSFQILSDFNRRRMHWDPVGCIWRRIDRLRGGADQRI